VTIRNCTSQPGTSTFLALKGKESSNVLLLGNDFRMCVHPFVVSDGAVPGSVTEVYSLPPEQK